MFTLTDAKDFLAVVGGAALLLAPVLRSYARSVIHGALGDSPTMIRLTDRVQHLEEQGKEHAEAVKVIPRLATVLERLDASLSQLNTTLVNAGLHALKVGP